MWLTKKCTLLTSIHLFYVLFLFAMEYDKNQVPWLPLSNGADSDARHHDPPGQRAHLGGGQEPAGSETAAGWRDE